MLCVLYFPVFKLFYLILENMSTNVIFDSCDVVYNWSISLLPPIVLDNIFDSTKFHTQNITTYNRILLLFIHINPRIVLNKQNSFEGNMIWFKY